MQPDRNPTFEALVDKIRREVDQHGEVIADLAILGALAGASGRGRWSIVSKIAMREGWSFTFLPSGNVQFATISPKEES